MGERFDDVRIDAEFFSKVSVRFRVFVDSVVLPAALQGRGWRRGTVGALGRRDVRHGRRRGSRRERRLQDVRELAHLLGREGLATQSSAD